MVSYILVLDNVCKCLCELLNNFMKNFPGTTWEMLELSGGSIELCQPKAQRLVLCVKPRCQGNIVCGDNSMNHLFLGFSTIWERNMWFCWLKEVRSINTRVHSLS